MCEVINNSSYKVLLDNGIQVDAQLSGKLRFRHFRYLKGESVLVELSPYDLTKGRIVVEKK